jgi:TonB family protein
VFSTACTNNNESTKSAAPESPNVATANDTAMNNSHAADTSAMSAATGRPVTKETKVATNKTTTRKKGKATVGTMAGMKSTRAAKVSMKPDMNGVYDVTEVSPSYPGGQAALSDYITNRIEYPQMAIDDNKEGTVNVQFIIDENGKVQDARVVGSKLGDGLDEEAERIISVMPKWTPGKVKGKPVKTRLSLPITYRLEE